MPYSYYLPTRFLMGAGAFERLGQEPLPGRKALVVIGEGGTVRSNGYLEKLLIQLTQAGIPSAVYDKIRANPTKNQVMEAAAQAEVEGCDFIVGLGGGSVIDAGKAIALMAKNPGDYWDYIPSGTGGGKKFMHAPLPLVAIPTTAGTGTEADPWLVVTNEETTEKIGFGTDATFPVLSVVDPRLMASMPPMLTAYTGFDALFHCMEGYLNRNANGIGDMLALRGVSLIADNLPQAIRHGDDLDARASVALASTLGGMVQTASGCISAHALEHALSAFHPRLPHGAGLIFLCRPYYAHLLRADCCQQRLTELARALGNSHATAPEDFLHALDALLEQCCVSDLSATLFDLDAARIPAYIRNARATMGGLFDCDPVTLTDEDCAKILRDALR